jgi:hypothetical protein
MTRLEDWEHCPKLTFSPRDSNYPDHWLATTHDGDYDASGSDPLNALANLIIVLSKALNGNN